MLSNLAPKANSVMGIDCSTQSFAFAIIENDKLKKWGEIQFEGKNVYERILDSRKKIDALSKEFDVDYVVLEAAIMVRSVQVAIKMAYVFGAVMASILNKNIRVVEVAPISWQNYIGNKALTPIEKAKIKKENPGKSKSRYTNKYRQVRKDKTKIWVKEKFDKDIGSDNVTDAIGIAWFGWNKTRR